MTDLQDKKNDPAAAAGDEDMQQYLREIRSYPRLTEEQERELARRCAQGDEEAIRHMVNSNLRLVVSVAREYAGRGVPLMDLIQEGSIGLLAAAHRYDYTLEFRFSTYATKWIRQGITRFLVDHGGMIRVPAHTAERIRKLQQARAELVKSTGQEPTVSQLAEKCGIPEAKAAQLLRLHPEVCSLNTPVGEADDSLGDLVEDLFAPQPYEAMVRRELTATMENLLASLNPRQRSILRLRFGMEDGKCHSLEEIGKILGISKERVRQVERQAMDKLQKLGAGMGLEDFLE